VELQINPFEDLAWSAQVDFVIEDELPFGLLGQEGFLNRWAVSFNAGFGYFVIEDLDVFHERLGREPLGDLERRFPGSIPRDMMPR
jgi:hypothetical protein